MLNCRRWIAARNAAVRCHASSENRDMAPIPFRQLAAPAACLSHLQRDAVSSPHNLHAEGPMDGLAVADAKSVVAPINFTMPMAEKPYSYNYEPPPGVAPRNTKEETYTVT